MSVNRTKILVNTVSGATGSSITIPIHLDFTPVDQSEIIERDFVNSEIEKSINPIDDYEVIRFIPQLDNGNQIEHIEYRLHLSENNSTMDVSTYDEIGFVSDDIKFRRNNLKFSFLRLSFYDSPIPTNQNLLFFMTLFTDIGGNFLNPDGTPRDLTQINLQFILSDPILFPENTAEGYYLYHLKDSLTGTPPMKEIYMRASYQNAKTGKSLNLMTTPTPQNITDLIGKLHTKYILKEINNEYTYVIDNSQGNVTTNLITGDDKVTVDLYEVRVL